jgi:hypothetical protein
MKTTKTFINIVFYSVLMVEVRDILCSLYKVRISRRMDEDEIHRKIMDAFDEDFIHYEHEYSVVPHKRFDFWIDGIVLEVKKEKPSKITLLNQLNRYTQADEVRAIIVVMEKSMMLPRKLNDKLIIVVSLNQNWGVAI